MSWLQPKLHLKVAQKQILTPGLVQMVSVLALNRLELREMITQEMVANPMLEEMTEETPVAEQDYSEETFIKAETEKVPETEAANPFDEFDIASFFNQYLDSGAANGSGEHEVIEKPSFEKFISSPQGLTEHLGWQLTVTVCNETVREIAEIIIGNLDENGYLAVSLEEIANNGNYSLEDVEEALATVQEFDPLGSAPATCVNACLRSFERSTRRTHSPSRSFQNACPSGPWPPPKRSS
jgi:RNA polymerase sigma-54 factor